MGYPQRRDIRHPTSLPVLLTVDHHTYVSVAENVSLRGLRVRTKAMPMVRQRVRLDVCLPDGGTTFMVTGHVAYSAVAQRGEHVAVGIDLSAQDGDAQQIWEQVVAWAEREAHSSARVSAATTAATFEPRTISDLHEVRDRTWLRGKLLVDLLAPANPGDRVHVIVLHPKTGRVSALEAEVVHATEAAGDWVAIVELARLSASQRRSFDRFVDETTRRPVDDEFGDILLEKVLSPAAAQAELAASAAGHSLPLGRNDSGSMTVTAAVRKELLGTCGPRRSAHHWLVSRTLTWA